MQVVGGWIAGSVVRSLPDVPTAALLAGDPHEPLQAELAGLAPDAQRKLCEAIVLNSTATLDPSGTADIVDNGNRTETALLRFVGGLGVGAPAERALAEVVAAAPFTSERKRMASVVRRLPAGGTAEPTARDGELTLFVKGAAEVRPPRYACAPGILNFRISTPTNYFTKAGIVISSRTRFHSTGGSCSTISREILWE